MRQRRSLALLLIVLVGLGVGLTFGLRSPSGGPGVPRPLTSSVRAGDLRVSVPEGFYRYAIYGGHMVGTPAPVVGYVLTDFALPAKVKADRLLARWSVPGDSGPPATRVALMLAPGRTIGPERLHLPLTVNQDWDHQRFNSGAIGSRFGFLRFHNADYQVMYWSGPAAPANDRAAILRALESIRPAR
ncbi:MAG: hypothetical protein QOG85_1098 [Gaiellaceae bacterium]|jgi:hypothetical protein|nr:hypothetical protein [Gaiellaceae bacterium]